MFNITSIIHYLLWVLLLALSAAGVAQSKSHHIVLMPGQVRTLNIQSIERIAIGNDNVVNYKISDKDELILIGIEPGDTSLHVWRQGNRQEVVYVQVSAGNVYRTLTTAKRLVRGMPGVTVTRVDNHIVFEGTVSQKQLPVLQTIVTQTPGGVLLTEVSPYDKQPMVRIDVHLLEITRSNLSDIGIRWSDTIAGPAGAISSNLIKSDLLNARSPDSAGGIDGAILNALNPNDSNFYGYVGITSSIVSQISLIQESGAGKVLASPKLVAASGSQATFQSGGSFPVPTINSVGAPSVEFIDYGIQLDIKPLVAGSGILTEVYAEVSGVDFSTAVNGVPGLTTRDTSTVINMNHGDTLAISGLATITDAKAVTKLPVLGDLPVLGPLFRATNKRHEEREVIVLVTTYLIEPDDVLDRPLQQLVEETVEVVKSSASLSEALMD